MAKRRSKSSQELKKKDVGPRQFNVAEITFIKANAPTMTIKQLAEALSATEQEVKDLIADYNRAEGNMIKQSFYVGKDRKKGVVIMTEGASQLGDEHSSPAGPQPKGFIKPKQDVDYIFKTKPDAH